MRRGGATELHRRGAPEVEVMRAGRWRSQIYQTYIESDPSSLASAWDSEIGENQVGSCGDPAWTAQAGRHSCLARAPQDFQADLHCFH